MRRVLAVVLVISACDEASFIVRVSRPRAGDEVSLRVCESCEAVRPFAEAPAALERSVGVFVKTAPQTLRLEWTIASRCDAFSFPFDGARSTFDVSLDPSRPPEVRGCASCGGPAPCTSSGGGAGGGTAGGGAGGGAAGGGTGGGAAGGGTGGGAAGGAAGGSAGGTAGGSAGASGGGSAGGSAGGSITSDGGPLTWTTMTTPTTVRLVAAVRAFSPTDAWAAARDNTNPPNVILHCDGGASWSPVVGNGDSESFDDLELTRTPRRIAALQASQVLECDLTASSCFSPASWQTFPVASPGGDRLSRLCTDGARLFASGNNGALEGTLYVRAGGTYAAVASAPGTGTLFDCAVLADGTVVAGGFGRLARFFPDGGADALVVSGPGFNGSTTNWAAVRTAGGRTFLAGDGRKIAEYLPDAGFALRFDQSPLPKLRVIGGDQLEELLAMGDDSTTFTTLRFDGGSWSGAPAVAPFFNVYDLTAADPNTWFAGGQQLNSSGGIVGGLIVRGRR